MASNLDNGTNHLPTQNNLIPTTINSAAAFNRIVLLLYLRTFVRYTLPTPLRRVAHHPKGQCCPCPRPRIRQIRWGCCDQVGVWRQDLPQNDPLILFQPRHLLSLHHQHHTHQQPKGLSGADSHLPHSGGRQNHRIPLRHPRLLGNLLIIKREPRHGLSSCQHRRSGPIISNLSKNAERIYDVGTRRFVKQSPL